MIEAESRFAEWIDTVLAGAGIDARDVDILVRGGDVSGGAAAVRAGWHCGEQALRGQQNRHAESAS